MQKPTSLSSQPAIQVYEVDHQFFLFLIIWLDIIVTYITKSLIPYNFF